MDENTEALPTGLPDTEGDVNRIQGVVDTEQPKDVHPSLSELREIQRNRNGFNVDINRPSHNPPKEIRRFNPRDYLGIYGIEETKEPVHGKTDDGLAGGERDSLPNPSKHKKPVGVRVKKQ